MTNMTNMTISSCIAPAPSYRPFYFYERCRVRLTHTSWMPAACACASKSAVHERCARPFALGWKPGNCS